jgi:hypothetical protein
MGPARRTFGFLCALALSSGGAVSFVDLLLFSVHARVWMFAAAGLVTFLGVYWLWSDYINATPNEEA